MGWERTCELKGELGSRNDVRYRLTEAIKVHLWTEDRYPQASYTPLDLRVGAWSEEVAVDELKGRIIKLYEDLRSGVESGLSSKEKGHLEHLERIVKRKPYDPRTAPTLATAAR